MKMLLLLPMPHQIVAAHKRALMHMSCPALHRMIQLTFTTCTQTKVQQ
jgi:hypothetical protein